MKTPLGTIRLIDERNGDPLPYYHVTSDCGIRGTVFANAPRDDWTATLRIDRTRYDTVSASTTARTRREAVEIAARMLAEGLK